MEGSLYPNVNVSVTMKDMDDAKNKINAMNPNNPNKICFNVRAWSISSSSSCLVSVRFFLRWLFSGKFRLRDIQIGFRCTCLVTRNSYTQVSCNDRFIVDSTDQKKNEFVMGTISSFYSSIGPLWMSKKLFWISFKNVLIRLWYYLIWINEWFTLNLVVTIYT